MTDHYPTNLNSPPLCREELDVHIMADYLELCCLAHVDYLFSIADLKSIHRGCGEAPPCDKDYDIYARAMHCCRKRQEILKERYPFEINGRALRRKSDDDFTEHSFLYTQLLYSANLEYFEKSTRSLLTSQFEIISGLALSSLFSDKFKISFFGKTSAANIPPHFLTYNGNTWNRLCSLAQDTRLFIMCKEEEFATRGTGDIGIDLAAWYPFEDPATILPMAFAQCACSKSEWSEKQSSISNDRVRNFFRSNSPFLPFIFIPHCFREEFGQWAQPSQIYTVIIDRIRILFLVSQDDVNSYNLILRDTEEFIKTHADLMA